MKDTEIIDECLVNFCLFADRDMISNEEGTSDEKWIQVMNEEIQSIEKSNTWELTNLPVGKKPIGITWFIRQNINLMVKLISLRQDWLQKTINRCHILIFLMFLHQLLDSIPVA